MYTYLQTHDLSSTSIADDLVLNHVGFGTSPRLLDKILTALNKGLSFAFQHLLISQR